MKICRRAVAAVVALALAAGPAESASAKTTKPLRVGFYLPWDAASKASLVQHAAGLDVLAPMSAALVSAGGLIRWQDDPARGTVLASTARKPAVFPVISNAHDNVWDTAASDGVILDAGAAEAFIRELVDQAQARGYAGYILDFENLSPKAMAGYAPLLAKLRARLTPVHRELWVTADISASEALIRTLADSTDAVVLMAYDECWATATPGPIAGQDWLETNLEAKLRHADPAHYIVALGTYGYDWPEGQAAAVIVVRSAPDANPRFTYRGADGRSHSVWFLDGATFARQRAAVAARRVRGVAVWRLGLEDEGIWRQGAPRSARGAGAPRGYTAGARCGPL